MQRTSDYYIQHGGSGMKAIAERLKAARPRKLDTNTLIAAADLGGPALARQAIEADVDVNSVDRFGIPALLVAIQTRVREIIEILLAHGADPNSTNSDGSESALTAAITDEEIVRRLIAAGADVNKPVWRGYEEVTPLSLAASDDDNRIAQLLRDAGATG